MFMVFLAGVILSITIRSCMGGRGIITTPTEKAQIRAIDQFQRDSIELERQFKNAWQEWRVAMRDRDQARIEYWWDVQDSIHQQQRRMAGIEITGGETGQTIQTNNDGND